jgi:phosphatidylserine decarboxylase
MLDSLGSTLSSSTISKFFTRYGRKAHEDELSFNETILCLEEELNRPEDQKRRLDEDTGDSSADATPVLQFADRTGNILQLDQLDFSGPANVHQSEGSGAIKTEPMQLPLHHVAASPSSPTAPEFSSSDDAEEDVFPVSPSTLNPVASQTKKGGAFKRKGKGVRVRVGRKRKSDVSPSTLSASDDSRNNEDSVERVINVKSCPLCHRPRMNSKAEMDIMTHIAVCASQDWNRVDRIMVGNFVTASQAQRKWYTKVISKLSSGNYKLGAVSDGSSARWALSADDFSS